MQKTKIKTKQRGTKQLMSITPNHAIIEKKEKKKQ